MVATADRGLHVKAKTSVSVENPMLFRCPPHQFAPTIPSLSMVVVVEGEGEESSAFSFSSCFASQLFVFNRTHTHHLFLSLHHVVLLFVTAVSSP